MSEARGRRFDRASVSAFIGLLLLGVLGLVGRLLTAHYEGYSTVSILFVVVVGVVAILLFVLLLFMLFDWRNVARIRALSALNPTAFIAQVVTDPTLVREIDVVAVRLSGRRSKVRQATYVTLVADETRIRFFGGSTKPREQASFPTSMLRSTTIGESQSGARIVPNLELKLAGGDGVMTLSIHLFSTKLSIPRFVRDQGLVDAQNGIRKATGTTG